MLPFIFLGREARGQGGEEIGGSGLVYNFSSTAELVLPSLLFAFLGFVLLLVGVLLHRERQHVLDITI